MIRTLTDQDFDREILGADAALVDFSAVHCGPCRALEPTVAALADAWAGKLTVGKLDIDENPVVAERYRVMAVPTLLVFAKGQVVAQIVGAAPRAKIEAAIRKATT